MTQPEPPCGHGADAGFLRIGAIQPHGALLILDRDRLVSTASTNAGDLIGRPVHGHGLDDLPLHPFDLRHGHSQGHDLVEVLPRQPAMPGLADRVRGLVAELAAAGEIPATLAWVLHQLTGCHRVAILRLAFDGTSEVVAESGDGRLRPIQGYSFSDDPLPPPVRRRLGDGPRLIVDAAAGSVPLDGPEAEIDLAPVRLRAVPEAHGAFLAELGVRGSFTVPIAARGNVWGLILAHHAGARAVTPDLVAAVETLARFAAERLQNEEFRRECVRRHVGQTVIAGVAAACGPTRALADVVAEQAPHLVSLFRAHGLAGRLGGRRIGESVPAPTRTPDLDQGILLAEQLAPALGWSQAPDGVAGGVFVDLPDGDFLLFLCGEVARRRIWKRPGHSPRSDIVDCRSAPFDACDREMALELRRAMVEHLAAERHFRTMARLRASEQRYRLLIECAGDPIYVHDRQGRILEVNQEACTELGYDRDELTAMTVADIVAHHDRDRIRRVLDGVVSGQPATVLSHHRRRDGSVLPVEVRLAVTGPDEADLVVALARDITARKEAEDVLRRAKAQAEKADRAKSAFLAAVSHELRTPLNAINGFADMLLSGTLGDLGSARHRDYVQDILDSGRHLQDLVEDLLDVARIGQGGMVLEEAAVDPAEIARAARDAVADRAARAQVTLDVATPDDLPRLWADGRRLRQVLGHLLVNGVKFSTPGGTVRLGLSHDRSLVIEVADTGIGMDPAEIETALAPFGQVDARLARRFEGAGLGLPLSRELIEAHGGSLTVASHKGAGTTVTVTLPETRVLT